MRFFSRHYRLSRYTLSAQRGTGLDTYYRSLVKSLSYRTLSVFVTTGVAWTVVGSLGFAATIGVLDTAAKLGLYFAHERAWNRIPLGRAEPPEYEI